MDQLRKAWELLQRHHFWVLTVLALLVALGCWLRGASTLLAEYKTNRGKIDAEFAAADTVKNKQYHANGKVQTAQNEQIAQQEKGVIALWKQLYARQTASVLQWPSNLSDGFRSHIEKLQFGDKISSNLRRHYNNYIQNHFPELPKIVGALVEEEGQGGMGRGGGDFNVRSFLDGRRNSGRGETSGGTDEAFEEPEFLVIWADQQSVRSQLYPGKTPSSKWIWKTQEDLWVYEALLTIIAKTNEDKGADRFSNAAVRVIESLEVGRTAALASRGKGRIEFVAPPANAGGMGEEGDPQAFGGGGEYDMGARGMEGYGGEGYGGEGYGGEGYGGEGYGGEGMGRGGMESGTAADAELFNNRYVDANGAPIPDPGDGGLAAFGTEFKRLPVRMRLWMDQRYVPQLIANCADAALQVEVQEIRINPEDGGAGGGGYGGGRGSNRGGEGGYSSGASATSVEMMPEEEPNMKTIILQGTIYIFNPPTEQPAADGTLASASVQ